MDRSIPGDCPPRLGAWPWPTTFVYNPKGCWDWWGYTGAGYHTRTGAQIEAVGNMLERLQGDCLNFCVLSHTLPYWARRLYGEEQHHRTVFQ